MSEEIVLSWLGPHVVQLQLNRAKERNTFTWSLLDELESKLEQLVATDVRVLLITGSGDTFCAGADLHLIQSFTEEDARRWIRRGHEVLRKVERFPVPVLAVLNGHAVGGGLELACACDLRLSVPWNKLGLPETRLGMIPGWGGTTRTQRLIGPAEVRRLVYTAALISGEEALRIGLVDAVYPSGDLPHRALELAQQIAANAPVALREVKRLLNREPSDFASEVEQDAEALARCVLSDDQTEGLKAFFEKRQPVFRGR